MNEEPDDLYNKIGSVFCPYLKDHVYFTRIGLEHLKFKSKFKARTERDKIMRIKMLPVSTKILSLSHTLQGKITRQRFEKRFVNNRKEIAFMYVTYYEFLAIIDGKRAKVIVKQTYDNRMVFLSVIPVFKQKMPLEESDTL